MYFVFYFDSSLSFENEYSDSFVTNILSSREFYIIRNFILIRKKNEISNITAFDKKEINSAKVGKLKPKKYSLSEAEKHSLYALELIKKSERLKKSVN